MSFEFVCVMMPPRGLLSEGNVAFGECFHHVLEHLGGRRLPFVLLRVIQHPGADTELTLLHLKDGMVDAAATAAPEGLIVGQLPEGDGHVAQLSVHLHHRVAGGEGEYFGVWPAHTRQCEGVVLDAFGNAEPLIVWMYYQS